MWCGTCHYGSETCVFEVNAAMEYVCPNPRCRAVDSVLSKSPFQPGTRTLSGKQERKGRREEER